jgi:hypothetical protein
MTGTRALLFICGAFTCLACATANAQQWKAALKVEKAKNDARMDAINQEGGPIAAQLNEVNAAIAVHNRAYPDGECHYPDGHPEVCAPWIREAEALNTRQARLVSRLKPLADEFDRLSARNREIARLLSCVPLPVACRSNADCNACSTCGTFDGNGRVGICQPNR